MKIAAATQLCQSAEPKPTHSVQGLRMATTKTGTSRMRTMVMTFEGVLMFSLACVASAMDDLTFHLVCERIDDTRLDDISRRTAVEIDDAVDFGSLAHRAAIDPAVFLSPEHDDVHHVADARRHAGEGELIAQIADLLGAREPRFLIDLALHARRTGSVLA